MNNPSELPHDEPPLSIKETAPRLTFSEKTIRRMIDAGQLPAFKIRGVWRILPSDVRILLQTPPQNLAARKHNATMRVQAQRGTSLSILLPAGQWPYELACAAWL
jgi:excisionase family DNA binding protein